MFNEQAVQALLQLAGPGLRVDRANANTVRFEVFSVKAKRGVMLLPLTFALEVEVFVSLDPASATYRFSGRSFEASGFSMRAETFRGIYRRKEWGKYLTWDGIVSVKFDTGAVFDRIEAVLQPLGWRRA